MGLDASVVAFLSGAKSKGVDFSKPVTIGRQWILASANDLRKAFAVLGVDGDADQLVRDNIFGDFFFELLGAKQVDSVDVSGYEQATIIHDMNRPIPPEHHRRFSLVFDGGSLEHIFNVPQALANCMEMVEVGGYYALVTAGNNSLGHGFWQISPELIFRVFGPANGFRVEVVLLKEHWSEDWRVVKDPEVMRRRVELCNNSPTYICCIAQRVALEEIFAVTPQQSDYVANWGDYEGGPPAAPGPSGTLRRLAGTLPFGVQRALRRMFKPTYDPSCYRRVGEADVLRGRWS